MADFNKYPDQELVPFLKEGNERVFTVIYDRYFSLLFRHALNLLKDEQQAEDVVQDVFTDLWVKRADLEIKSSLSAYLFAGARHAAIKVIRRSQVADKYIENLIWISGQDLPMTDDLARERELQQVIEAEISKLPGRMREVFELSRKQQQSHREIAEKLDLSEHTVKRQIGNALIILKRKLAQWIFYFSFPVFYIIFHFLSNT